jgi:putative transcriptional regulator
MSTHHPSVELLFDYATGALPEGASLAIATHASLCRQCRDLVHDIEGIGGTLFENTEPEAIAEGALDLALARIEEGRDVLPSAARSAFDAETVRLVPEPLRRYLPASLNDLKWRKVGGMFEEVRLAVSPKALKVALMRLKPGSLMPRHGHKGFEYTLVLAGGYRDNGKQFGPGDFDAKDSSQHHQPRVDDDGECLCLAVLDAPVKLSGTLGRLVNPFLRI